MAVTPARANMIFSERTSLPIAHRGRHLPISPVFTDTPTKPGENGWPVHYFGTTGYVDD